MRCARCAGGTWKGMGAAGSRTSWKWRRSFATIHALLPGVRHLAAPGRGIARPTGRTATCHLSLFTCHCGRRPRRCARCAGGRAARSESSPHHGAVGRWKKWGAAGKPHLRKWRGSFAASHAGLPGVRHLAATGWEWQRAPSSSRAFHSLPADCTRGLYSLNTIPAFWWPFSIDGTIVSCHVFRRNTEKEKTNGKQGFGKDRTSANRWLT